MPGELVQLDERALVQQQLDPLTGRQLALGVLLFDGAFRTGVRRLVDAPLEIRELPRGRVNVDPLDLVDLVTLFRLGHRDAAPCLLKGGTVTHS
ncbi:hypothetical protein ACFQ3Z_28870 [Streptomyces nogalater]